MFNKYFWLAFFWHIVQMYFPNTFEISYLNRVWVMGLYADILLGEVVSENRKEETGKNKTSKPKGGEVNPWWIIELSFQWKFELNLSKNSWEIMKNQTVLTAQKEEGYFNPLLVKDWPKDWSRRYYPFAGMGFCIFLDDFMSSPPNSLQWLGKKTTWKE